MDHHGWGYRHRHPTVSEVWKGPKQRTVEVTTGADSGMGCGYSFEDGREYLVYAGKGISVDLCRETKPLAKARADLAVLGNGENRKYGGDALSDTSGGFGGRDGRDSGACDGGVGLCDGAAHEEKLVQYQLAE